MTGVLRGYPAGPLDEAVDPDGQIRPGYVDVVAALDGAGIDGLRDAATELDRLRAAEGIVFTADIDGVLQEQPFPLDPIPRLLSGADWARISAGLRQRTRALNAFLDDVYDQAQIVRDGLMPDWVVQQCPGFLPGARDLAPGGRPRATVLGFDLLHPPSGEWVVLEDNLRVPSGLGYAVANRRTAAAALPMLYPWDGVRSPDRVGAMLLEALISAAPPRCRRETPQVALLSDGPANSAWYEHTLLARAMGVPVVTPADLAGDADGITAMVDGRSIGVDVLYRRLADDEIIAGPAVSPEVNLLLQDGFSRRDGVDRECAGQRRRRRQGDLRVRPHHDRLLPRRETRDRRCRDLGAGRSGPVRGSPGQARRVGGEARRRIRGSGGDDRAGDDRRADPADAGVGGRRARALHRPGGDPVLLAPDSDSPAGWHRGMSTCGCSRWREPTVPWPYPRWRCPGSLWNPMGCW